MLHNREIRYTRTFNSPLAIENPQDPTLLKSSNRESGLQTKEGRREMTRSEWAIALACRHAGSFAPLRSRLLVNLGTCCKFFAVAMQFIGAM